ncbi:hypothetical protein N7488_005156 [Penicillium malachiteum]|nr:hypothetical protein N7488_005156 [Penicillium malachiteum]
MNPSLRTEGNGSLHNHSAQDPGGSCSSPARATGRVKEWLYYKKAVGQNSRKAKDIWVKDGDMDVIIRQFEIYRANKRLEDLSTEIVMPVARLQQGSGACPAPKPYPPGR